MLVLEVRWPMSGHERTFEDDPGFPFSGTVRGAIWRIAATVVAAVVWLSLTLLYLAFWAHGLTLFQYLVVGTVSVLSLFGAMVIIWVTFGLRFYHKWTHW